MHRSSAPSRFLRAALLLATLTAVSSNAQTVNDPALAQDIVHKLLAATAPEGRAYRYTLQRTDHKGTVTRIAITTPTGTIARTFLREGKPFTPEQHAAEKARLTAFINSPSDQRKKTKSDATSRKYTQDICKAMPSAMIYTMHPGQPQLPQFPSSQIVLDFNPRPDFNPDGMAQETLRGISGTLWIDARTHLLRRLEAHSTKDITFMLGLVAKVHPGAKIESETIEWMPGRLAYARSTIDAVVRELLFKTQHFQSNERSSDFQQLKDGLTLSEAAQLLIDLPDNAVH